MNYYRVIISDIYMLVTEEPMSIESFIHKFFPLLIKAKSDKISMVKFYEMLNSTSWIKTEAYVSSEIDVVIPVANNVNAIDVRVLYSFMTIILSNDTYNFIVNIKNKFVSLTIKNDMMYSFIKAKITLLSDLMNFSSKYMQLLSDRKDVPPEKKQEAKLPKISKEQKTIEKAVHIPVNLTEDSVDPSSVYENPFNQYLVASEAP